MTCPNCEQEFEGDRCPNCGRSQVNVGNRVAAICALIFVFLPVAAFGTCSSIVGISGLSGNAESRIYAGIGIVVGVVALLTAAAMLVGVVKLWKG